MTRELLNNGRLSSRLPAEQVAAMLGRQPCDVPAVVTVGLPRSSNYPAQPSKKWATTRDLETKSVDGKWLYIRAACPTTGTHHMSSNSLELLNCRRLPSRLTAEQVAVLLGCQTHDIPVIVRAGLLRPLGNPVQNATKWFATKDLEEKMADEK